MREAFEENAATRGELGAAVTVFVHGREVLDLCCGWADAQRTRAWEKYTLVNAFSVGKALAGLCALILVSRGRLDLDEPISRYWRQFASAGKETITVRQLLSHRAGMAAIRRDLPEGAIYDWDSVTGALAEQEPWWTPGVGHGYHVHTFGFLVGEIVRRVSGEAIGSFLRRQVARPLGADVSFGLPRQDGARCAEYIFDPPRAPPTHHNSETAARTRLTDTRRAEKRLTETRRDRRLRERAYLNPPGATGLGTVNTTAWRDAEIPSANLHAGARDIARVYDELVSDAPSIIDREVLREATREAAVGEDIVLERPSRFGLGFQLTQPERPLGPNPAGFGHFGAGGSLGFADPDAGVAFAYVMNRGGPQWQDPRNRALIDAVYRALDG